MREFNFEEYSIVEVVNEIIIDAIKKRASDIHFDPTPNNLLVRIRIDGELQDYAIIPEELKKNLITRIKIISGMNITEARLPQDGAIKSLKDLSLDLRVSTLPVVYGEKIVIRILDYSMSLEGLEYLGFLKNNLNRVEKMLTNPNGLILVTGATGTGKSTTVYALLQRLNNKERNIMTVEDPVEMRLENVNQVQVQSEIGLNFSHTLRSILRQDPDIIMVGEIRDDETARIAVRASITGHLVLSTVHTNNSLTTIERLLDMKVERYLLGTALTGIISQKLVKRLCPDCKEKRATTSYEQKLFRKHLGKDVKEIYTAHGCSKCHQGFMGRIAIQEVLAINEEIRDAIITNVDRKSLKKLVYKSKDDVTTLFEDGLSKVYLGETTMEEILKTIDVASNEELDV